MQVYNRTKYSESDVNGFTEIKRGRNNWRGRNIRLYAHPEDDSRIVSDGITFDGSMRVIADETRADWARELSCRGDFTTD